MAARRRSRKSPKKGDMVSSELIKITMSGEWKRKRTLHKHEWEMTIKANNDVKDAKWRMFA